MGAPRMTMFCIVKPSQELSSTRKPLSGSSMRPFRSVVPTDAIVHSSASSGRACSSHAAPTPRLAGCTIWMLTGVAAGNTGCTSPVSGPAEGGVAPTGATQWPRRSTTWPCQLIDSWSQIHGSDVRPDGAYMRSRTQGRAPPPTLPVSCQASVTWSLVSLPCIEQFSHMDTGEGPITALKGGLRGAITHTGTMARRCCCSPAGITHHHEQAASGEGMWRRSTSGYDDGASIGPGWSSSSDSDAMTPLAGRERFSEKAALHSETGGERGAAFSGVPVSPLTGARSDAACTVGRGVIVSTPMVSAPRSESVRNARLSCIFGGCASATESGPASGLCGSIGEAVLSGEGGTAAVDGLALEAIRALRVMACERSSLEKGCMLGRSAGVLRSESMEPGIEDLAQYAARTSRLGTSGTESTDVGCCGRLAAGAGVGGATVRGDTSASSADVTPEGGLGGTSGDAMEADDAGPKRACLLREDGRGVGRGFVRGVVAEVVRGVRWEEPAWEAEEVGCRLYDAGGCTAGAEPCSILGAPSAARSREAAWAMRRPISFGLGFLAFGGRGIICSCVSVDCCLIIGSRHLSMSRRSRCSCFCTQSGEG